MGLRRNGQVFDEQQVQQLRTPVLEGRRRHGDGGL